MNTYVPITQAEKQDSQCLRWGSPVFLPGICHGPRSLAGYSHRVAESDITKVTELISCVPCAITQTNMLLMFFCTFFFFFKSFGCATWHMGS